MSPQRSPGTGALATDLERSRHLPRGAIGAVAIGGGGEFGQGHTLHFGRLAQDRQQARVVEPVVDESPLAARLQQAGFAQGHQVLGEGSLPQVEHGFEMADARLALADGQQDLQAGFLPDGLEQCGDLLN